MENEQQKWHECVFLCIIHSLTFGEAFKSQCFMSSLKKTSCLQFKIEKLVLSHSNRVPLLIFATQHIKVKKKNKNNFSKQPNFSYKHNTNTHTHTLMGGREMKRANNKFQVKHVKILTYRHRITRSYTVARAVCVVVHTNVRLKHTR